MADRKTPPTRATPSPEAEVAPQAPETASAAPSAPADPGPPPTRPAQPLASYGNPVADRLFSLADEGASAATRTTAREYLRGASVLRQPPAVHAYRAELLQWLDDLDAYEARLP